MDRIFFVVPGIGNSDENHWQSLWENKSVKVKRIEQQDWVSPVCKDWVSAIETEISKHANKQIVLVAHSLGCLAVAHWAHQTNYKISGALLVAPPDVDKLQFNHTIRGFSPMPLRKLPFKSMLIASTNDEYADISKAWQYAHFWGSEFINVGNKGHINSQSNLGEWIEGQKLLSCFLETNVMSTFA